jgi:LmbE family N-acetylglucosaminyl deacetylase
LLCLAIPPDAQESFKLLCLGAHSDDIEIGCGGTILRIAAEVPGLIVRWIVFSAMSGVGPRRGTAPPPFLSMFLRNRSRCLGSAMATFPLSADIKDYFESVKRDFDPSLILTHWQNDAHQDHRLLAELTFNTFRNHLVLEYEIPKYDGDLGNPNFFVPLTRAQLQRKIDTISRHFVSQRGRNWV